MEKKSEGTMKTSFLRDVAFPEPDLCKHCHASKMMIADTEHDLRIMAPESRNVMGQTPRESGVCGVCHIIHNGPNELKIWARRLGPPYLPTFKKMYRLEENKSISLCLSCHYKDEVAEAKQPTYGLHPQNLFVGIRSGYASPNAQPIYPFFKGDGAKSDSGEITCPTCHDAHWWNPREEKKGPGKNTEGNVVNSFLRKDLIFGLCTDCHSFDALYRVKYFHVEKRK